jgi:hypothetical protein
LKSADLDSVVRACVTFAHTKPAVLQKEGCPKLGSRSTPYSSSLRFQAPGSGKFKRIAQTKVLDDPVPVD